MWLVADGSLKTLRKFLLSNELDFPSFPSFLSSTTFLQVFRELENSRFWPWRRVDFYF